MVDPFDRLAFVAGASVDVAGVARSVVGDAARATSPLAAARALKRRLAAGGFRDESEAFTIDAMLARRGGNCLGLTLFLGAALLEAGHDVGFVRRRNPYDDVHVAGEEQLARLSDPNDGVDADSRLPDAGDCTSRFRFVAVEHASLLLRNASGGEQPFEATTVGDPDVDSTWAPPAETIENVGFHELSATVWNERAKILLRSLPLELAGTEAERGVVRRATRLVLRSLREAPQHREGWADLWRATRLLPRSSSFTRLNTVAAERYVAFGGNDSLFELTRYRLTGDVAHLDAALARFPASAEAHFEKHVVHAASVEHARRGLVLTAWLVAESEILDLERFYREHAASVIALFSERELEELLATFAQTTPAAGRSRGPS